MYQSEAQLENHLIKQLTTLGFQNVFIKDETELIDNLKSQLEKFNNTTFTDLEFTRILNHLNKGDRFNKAKNLRDRYALTRDENGINSTNLASTFYVKFFNTENYCKNEYQVTNQITLKGKYENRYDVTILINGLPLVQIELKRRGLEMKEAFNQIRRYHKHTFTGTLFEYIQIFIISNGVNTKYFSNNPNQEFVHTFYWTDKENKKIAKLEDFANIFLEKCALSEMISEFIVLAESTKTPMILRPYQYYAVKEIERKAKESINNGYIWHTTGSGKTLTSFKTSQILSKMPEIKKVIFVVDRKDLDIQTTKEFNSFSDGSVDGTNNTSNLVNQLKDPNRKLIVTTIQKLDIAIGRESYLNQIKNLENEKVVIIFDECHRSQFGKTHAAIKGFFKNSQLFGFTGTPIFAENNNGGVTTKDVFGECLHKYIITNAISDNNVLGFAIEYVGKYKKKDEDVIESEIETDTYVENINTKEVLESTDRLTKITDYILKDWKIKTKNGKYHGMFAVSNVATLKKYYNHFRAKKPEDFKIATIFTYAANEEFSPDVNDLEAVEGEELDTRHSREFLEDAIQDYNEYFSTNYSTDRFYDYYKDLQKRIKDKQIDLVLVVNMFLTGFDSKFLNTLYVDKNLKYHGLVQAYSRTNRLESSDKPHGNIVAFRNLKQATDQALALYGDVDAKEIVFKKPFEDQKFDFEKKLIELKEITPTVESAGNLQSEESKLQFVKAFRDLLRIKASLETFSEFSFDTLSIPEQEFQDYQSKYLDIYAERTKTIQASVSILEDVDFEIELTMRDIIDFDYILKLVIGLTNIESDEGRQKQISEILKQFDQNLQLRKKKDLIKKFIEENLPMLKSEEDAKAAFDTFWSEERKNNLKQIADSENISVEKLEYLINEYFYTQKLPGGQEIVDMLSTQPKILERQGIIDRIRGALENIIEVFEW